jgi:hypothetical protein
VRQDIRPDAILRCRLHATGSSNGGVKMEGTDHSVAELTAISKASHQERPAFRAQRL